MTRLERIATDQRRPIAGMVFKVIPAEPSASLFRDKF